MAQCRNSPIAKCLASLAAFFAAALTVFGQTQAPRPEFRAPTELGHVDVIVLDGKRQPVRGLTASDFTLALNRVTTRIQAFAAVDLASAQALGQSSWVRNVSPDVQTNAGSDDGRLVVIYFDRSIAPGTILAMAKRIAAAAVQELGPHDLAAVLGARGRPVQNFTADRALLLKAIEEAIAIAPGTDEGEMANRVFAAEPGALSAFRANDACFCNTCVLRQVAEIADGLRHEPKPKVLLFIGSQLTLDARDIDPVTPLIAGGATQAAQCSTPVRDARTAMLHALDRTNVTVHTLDPSGLKVNAPTASSSYLSWEARVQADQMRTLLQAYQGQIRVLPDRTGGRVVTNTNAPQMFVPAVFAETGAYYMLGFDPPPGDSAIEVKVRGRGLVVHYQRIFDPVRRPSPQVASSAVPPVATTPSALAASAASELLSRQGLPIGVAAMPFLRTGSTSAEVLIAIEFPSSRTEVSPPGVARDERVELFIGAFDRRSTSLREERLGVEIQRSGSGRDQEYGVLSSLGPLGGGPHEIRVGAAGGGKVGSVIAYVDIPKFVDDPLSLSGVAVTPTVAGAATAFESAKGALPFVPTARRAFRPDEVVRLFARVYQGGRDELVPVKVELRVVDSHDVVKVYRSEILGPEQFGPARAADISGEVPLSGLAPGEYLLSVGAVDGKNTVRRDLRFTVK